MQTKFSICRVTRFGKTYWRIRIPAKLSSNGKVRDLIYPTRAAAEEDRRELLDRFSRGEFSRDEVLTSAQVSEAQKAFAELADGGGGMSLVEAVREALRVRQARLHGISVVDMLRRYEEEVSESRRWSSKYRQSWRTYSRRFAEKWGEMNIADVQTEPLREWYAEQYGQSASYYNSALAVMAPVFAWAVKRDMLVRNPFVAIERRKPEPKDGVDVYTPDEARRLLAACRDFSRAGKSHPMADARGYVRQDLLQDCTDALVPFAILLFAGIRPEELTKLTWQDVFADGDGVHIRVGASVAKTRQIRIVRVRPTLQRFLALVPASARTGKIVPQNWKRKASIVRKAAGLQSRPDAARQLIETIRSATPTTPETVTAYTRDAVGHALKTEECIGAMKRVSSAEYDLQGRVVKSTDVLGRVTQTEYSENGLKKIVTTPAGAKLITLNNLAGSVIELSGDGQRGIRYVYDYEEGLRTTQQILSSGEMISSTVENGYDETILSSVATTVKGESLDIVSAYNNKGQLMRQQSGQLAPTTYAYDSMGNQVQQTQLLDSSSPADATKNVIVKQARSYQKLDDGVYQVLTSERNNAEGEWLTSVQQTLVSQLSPILASKRISVDERDHVSTSWTEYGVGTKRKNYQQIPTSNITAETITIDGFTTSQTDNVGITTTASRRYLEKGVELKSTDGRGNTTTTFTDIAERTILVTDAAGYSTTTQYDPFSNNPAVITDAVGNTTCYAYDGRGRKVAEYGTAVQPVVYAYDDADRMISLTTWRVDDEVISTDPQGREGGDTTSWEYNDATGLLLKQIYADGKGIENAYDAANRLSESRDARGVVTTYQYDTLTGNTLSVSYTAPEDVMETATQSYVYNVLGQSTSITDASGTHNFSYNEYGDLLTESIQVNSVDYTLNELLDDYGRSIGYRQDKAGAQLCAASVGYATDGRIGSAAFTHSGKQQTFSYAYLLGSNLLQTLTLPNNMQLTQSYAEKRDLLTEMLYTRGGSVQVTRRSYAYDALGRPYSRDTEYPQKEEQHTAAFGYNSRSELTNAQLDDATYAYSYDNIGNRITAQEAAEEITYAANELNQYTQIDTNGNDFTPEYDANGNQTLVKTGTGIWRVTYNAKNRAVRFESEDGNTIIDCTYDYMGRRFEKKVTTNGTITLRQRYLYRGYMQIAAIDLQRSAQPALWYITWDPTQTIATRPLAIQKDGTWYTYGWDLTKNACEIYGPNGNIRTIYTYRPYGAVTAEGDVTQPLQWSCEYHDTELALSYYNYRYYNPLDGRWIKKDSLKSVILEQYNDYAYVLNAPYVYVDVLGLYAFMQCERIRTEQSFYYKCKMYIYGPCNNRCCEDETKAAGDAKDVETLEAALSKLRSCMEKNNSGSLDVEVTDHIYANLGENAESTTEGDPYGSSGPLPEGTYRILPRSTGKGRYPLGTPSITGLDQDVPGEVVTPNGTNRNCLFVHGPGKSEGCLAMQNNMEKTIKETMDSQSTCGGTYLQIIGE